VPPRAFIGKLAALTAVVTLPLWAMLAFKWPINTDFIVYATILKPFSSQLWSGEFYPRWLMNTNDGFGGPVFLFYSPLSFYIGSLFEWLATFDPNGYGRVLIMMTLAIFTCGITSYRWLKPLLPPERAQEGALIYAGFPYLLTIMYSSMGVAQLWAMVWLPLLLEAAHDMTQKNWRAIPKLSVAYALLALTHLPTTTVFAAIPCLYVSAFAPRGKHVSYLFLSGFAAALGACLAALYLLPAVENKPFVTSIHFLDDQLVYSHNFYHLRAIGGLFCIPLPLLGLYTELPKAMRRHFPSPVRFWIIISFAIFFMITPLSRPIWDHVTFLHYLQFPFRFYNAMVPGAVFIAISWLPHVKKNRNFFLWFTGVCLIYMAAYCEEAYFLNNNTHAESILKHNTVVAPEYHTHWMEDAGINSQWGLPEHYMAMAPVTFMQGSGQAEIVAQTPRSITLHADISSPKTTLVLRRFYFPGWQTENSSVTIHEAQGLLAVDAPSGSYDITLALPWFAGEKMGISISLAALFLWIALMLAARRKAA